MAIEKTAAIIVRVLPYRETSCIACLLTLTHGMVHGIVKGASRRKNQPVRIERGTQIECLVYHKPHRELHTLADIHLVDFFPSIRTNLEKSAARDLVCELILKSIPGGGDHTTIFNRFSTFLQELDCADNQRLFPLLWRFLHRYSEMMGFMLHCRECVRCSERAAFQSGGFLNMEKGGIICKGCAEGAQNHSFVPSGFIELLATDKNTSEIDYSKNAAECIHLTRLLISYCRYHLDIRKEFDTLGYLESLIRSFSNQ